MSRPLRIQFPNASYHITSRGIRRDPIFFDDDDRRKLIEKMIETFEKYLFIVHAFCLMPNHYHVFLQTPLANLSAGLHDLNASYANWLRCKHRLVGHVFQGRFKSILVDTETYAVNLSIYIHLNPCRWRLVELPEEYEWSSCRDYLGLRAPLVPALDRQRVLSIVSPREDQAPALYKSLLRERREMDDPLKQAYRRIALGSPAFVDRIRRLVNQRAVERNTRELPVRTIRHCRALTPEQVFEEMAGIVGCSIPEILTPRHGRPWRAMGMYLAKRHCPIGLCRLGTIWGVDYTSISRNAREFSVRREHDASLRRQVDQIESRLEELKRRAATPRLGGGTFDEKPQAHLKKSAPRRA